MVTSYQTSSGWTLLLGGPSYRLVTKTSFRGRLAAKVKGWIWHTGNI